MYFGTNRKNVFKEREREWERLGYLSISCLHRNLAACDNALEVITISFGEYLFVGNVFKQDGGDHPKNFQCD